MDEVSNQDQYCDQQDGTPVEVEFGGGDSGGGGSTRDWEPASVNSDPVPVANESNSSWSWSGGSVSSGTTTAIDTSFVTKPAPMSVYQHGRKDASTYTLQGFAAGTSHTVRLHFAEYFHTAAGQRKFNVAINGVPQLFSYDIVADAGAPKRAVDKIFNVAASDGQITIEFTPVVSNPKVSAIEITP